MENQPLSVVITTYERGSESSQDNFLIERAISSVLKQSYPVAEIVIVVDGTSKYIKNILRQYGYPSRSNLRLVMTRAKVGGSEARNIGMKLAQGPVLALLDDDDEWLPNKLAQQMQVYKSQIVKDSNFVIFSPIYIGQNQEAISEQQRYIVGHNIANYILEGLGMVQTSSLLFNKSVFLHRKFTKKLPKHQDWDWVFRLYFECGTSFFETSKPLSYYHTDAAKNNSVGGKFIPLFSLKWISNYRLKISNKAFDSFVWSYVVLPTLHWKGTFIEKIRILQALKFRNFFRSAGFRFIQIFKRSH
ncbi:hypothetical protein ATW97_07280 [Oenococcus oeni]|uniref:glycosyltransferase family 2 protein n=1 Tax=Oenococcus oeni TaxID=1247 RepID=UPI0004ABF0A0|nr:glycosyltransferase family 2 protein [Oenococcus oeni]KEP87359.1 hypothetical protein X279_07495 [Oenococcus oeni IOEB_0501]OIL34708.1 hypothetical protein ATX10_07550 [Oenococcus oeni]OIM35089.1 hypothetical protein ATX70_07445 [Oenococcus oeni]OIM58130.1 hypothetical protein ATX85_09570 [Oenococcus oeni]OLQ30096.1 hypothetical protein ATW97_07280 [Oenococcus oeni]